MECVPWLNVDVVKEAEPFASVAEPSTVAPSRNCTEPVAEEGETEAVKTIADPTVEGFREDASEVEVVPLTTSESALE
jgi:hypothetical protein